MNILLWIVLGALAGWIASALTKSSSSIWMDIILGIVGSFLGGWIMNQFGSAGVTGFNLYSIIVSILGAVVLIWLARLLKIG